MSNKVFTPENISKLKQNEVFVFGSNKAGNHVGGAARVAVEKFGAIMGHGEGLQGQSYAIPTLDEQMDKVSTEELTRSVRRFADYTRYNTDKVFYVTKIGCGIAGFSVEEIVEVFKSVSFGDNVVLPQEFGEEKHIDGFKGFNADMTCLGFKFEEGKTYEEDVELKVCNRGFHFCESPFSVLSYRDMLDDECKFIPVHHVTALGRCHSDSDKTATTKIHIGAKLDFKGFIKAGIDFIYEKCIKEGPTDNVNSGYGAKIGSSGYGAKIGSSGDLAKIGTILGCFQNNEVPGKIQHGSAWWFNDHKYGMEEHMKSLASLSLLGNFVGMLTDSRSFISYPRHEYFRRILCNYIGNLVENGEYPEDYDLLGEIVKNISYYNAVNYFGFDLK